VDIDFKSLPLTNASDDFPLLAGVGISEPSKY
jgi:hypothetical protein